MCLLFLYALWPWYGHVPDNELDSNELDWIGLVVLFSDMHPRCTCMDSSGGQIPKNEASVRLTMV